MWIDASIPSYIGRTFKRITKEFVIRWRSLAEVLGAW